MLRASAPTRCSAVSFAGSVICTTCRSIGSIGCTPGKPTWRSTPFGSFGTRARARRSSTAERMRCAVWRCTFARKADIPSARIVCRGTARARGATPNIACAGRCRNPVSPSRAASSGRCRASTTRAFRFCSRPRVASFISRSSVTSAPRPQAMPCCGRSGKSEPSTPPMPLPGCAARPVTSRSRSSSTGRWRPRAPKWGSAWTTCKTWRRPTTASGRTGRAPKCWGRTR